MTGEDTVAKAMTSMRERARSTNLARVDVIADAVQALKEGRLDEDQRARAEHAAHGLAGSAGTFGFEAATAPAQDLEVIMAGIPTAIRDESARAQSSLTALRTALDAYPSHAEEEGRP